MRANCLFVCVVGLALVWPAPGARAGLTDDIVSQISADSIWDFNSCPNFLYTQPGDSRRHNAPSGYTGANFYQAQNNIRDTFASYYGAGNVVVDTADGWNNVWVTKLGTVHPDKIYLVGSHYDSFTFNAADPAPGANDNGSGVSAVLEMARVLKDYQFENTIIFTAFDGEESGLNGSYQWTQAHASANIAGMIEMDCIGYNPNNIHHNKAIIYTGHSQSLTWRTNLAAAMSTWSGGVLTATAADQLYDCSDYARFEDHGWPAAILAEDGVWEDYDTIMHTVNDNINFGHIDKVFEGNMVKGVTGFLSTQLEPVGAPGDVNHDGAVNSMDIDAIYAGFGQPYSVALDVSHDGLVSQADVDYELRTIMHTNYGDANMDRCTDFTDFQALLDHWQGTGGWATGDFTGDQLADFADFQKLVDYWNPEGWSFVPSQVPEPTSLALLAVGMGLFWRRRQ